MDISLADFESAVLAVLTPPDSDAARARFAASVFEAHVQSARAGGADAEARAAEAELARLNAEMSKWAGVPAGPPARLADAHLEL